MNKEQKWYEYIPGFKGEGNLKKIFASLYYIFALANIRFSLGFSLVLLTLPFLLTYGVRFIISLRKGKRSSKAINLIFLLSLLSFISSCNIYKEDKIQAKQIEEARIMKEKEKAERKAEEERRKKEEEERIAKAEERIEKVKEKKEKERLAEEKKKKEEEEKRLAEEKKKKEEEEKRLAEEKKKKEEEEKRLAEEKKKKEEERKVASSNNNSGGGNSSSGGNKKPFPKVKESETNTSFPYLINTNTGKFHKTTCRHAKRTKESNRSYAKDRGSIVSSGYSPCKVCSP